LLFSLRGERILTPWNPFVASKRGEFTRSVLLLQSSQPKSLVDQDTDNGSGGRVNLLVFPLVRDRRWIQRITSPAFTWNSKS
jgi:hypothetical protein